MDRKGFDMRLVSPSTPNLFIFPRPTGEKAAINGGNAAKVFKLQ